MMVSEGTQRIKKAVRAVNALVGCGIVNGVLVLRPKDLRSCFQRIRCHARCKVQEGT